MATALSQKLSCLVPGVQSKGVTVIPTKDTLEWVNQYLLKLNYKY